MRTKTAYDEREARIGETGGRQHGLITARQLAALGLTSQSISRRVAAGRLHRVHRGVYAVGHKALTPGGRRLAAVLAHGELALASHVTAAAIWELRQSASMLIHVTVPGRGRDRPGIRAHSRWLSQDDRALRDGTPVTSLARTLVDLGDVVPATQVRNAFVRAEQLRLIDMTAIDAALARAGRTRGAARLGEVLRVYDPRWERTRSALELAFLDLAQRFALPEPEINAWIEDRFLVDALWRDARVIAEVDGARFHDTPSARRDDARRDQALATRGYRVVRVTHADVVDRPAATAARIARELAQVA